jgi:hypothetical protein
VRPRTGGRRSKPAVLGLSVAGLQLGRFRCSLPNTSPWTCSRSRLLWMCPHWAVLLVVGTPAICQRGGVSIWWGHHRIWDVAATPAQGHQEIDARRFDASPERPRAWTGLRPSRGQSWRPYTVASLTTARRASSCRVQQSKPRAAGICAPEIMIEPSAPVGSMSLRNRDRWK